MLIQRFKTKFISDKHLSELLKGSSIAFLFRIVGLIFSYILTLMITRVYGPESMGILALSMVVITMSSVFSRLGIDIFLLRFTADNIIRNNWLALLSLYTKSIIIITISTITISLIVFFSASFLANDIFENQNLELPFKIASIFIFPFTVLFINAEVFRGLKKIAMFSIFKNGIIPIISIVLLVFMWIFLQINIYIPFFAQGGAILVSAFFSVIYIIHIFRKQTSYQEIDLSKNSIKYILSISFPMMFAASMYLIMTWVDTIMVGIYTDIESVGIYNVDLKIAMLASIVLIAVNSIAAPKFSELWSANKINELSLFVKKSTKLIIVLSIPILLFIIIFPTFVLSFFGESFEKGYIALIILIIGQFINAVTGSTDYILNMTGKEKIVRNITFVATVTNVILNYLLVPRFGIEGAAIATTFSIFIWKISGVIYLSKKMKINII